MHGGVVSTLTAYVVTPATPNPAAMMAALEPPILLKVLDPLAYRPPRRESLAASAVKPEERRARADLPSMPAIKFPYKTPKPDISLDIRLNGRGFA